MAAKIVMLLAEGFEEAEVVIPADVLRRLEFDLTIAGVASKSVTGSHNMRLEADTTLDRADMDKADALILPGGMPGSKNLLEDERVVSLARRMFESGRLVAAICAAPIVLGKAGILKGKKATCYPGFEAQLFGADYTGARTERDGNIITGKGPGASFECAARVAEALGAGDRVGGLFAKMFVEGR